MPRVSAVVGRRVFGSDDRSIGRVTGVLFHPEEPRAVGLQIQPHPLWLVISRRPRFALIEEAELVGEESVRLPGKGLPADAAGEKALGVSWHDTVVWQGMPVVSASGVAVGAVIDAVITRETRVVKKLFVSTGVFGDTALGRLEVDGEFVRGFDGEHVVVLPGYNEIRATGGAAKKAAAGTARVKVHGERLAQSALKTSAAAAAMVGRSFRSGAGRKVVDKMKSLMDDGE